jgi:hypothetical protein
MPVLTTLAAALDDEVDSTSTYLPLRSDAVASSNKSSQDFAFKRRFGPSFFVFEDVQQGGRLLLVAEATFIY